MSFVWGLEKLIYGFWSLLLGEVGDCFEIEFEILIVKNYMIVIEFYGIVDFCCY